MIMALIIGKYTLSINDEGFIWLEEAGGEGMEVNPGRLEDMLDKFYKENF